MNLKEKIAQMLMIDFSYANASYLEENKRQHFTKEIKKAIQKYKIGGVVLFAKALEDVEQSYRFICELQEAATNKKAINQIPLLMAIDQEGGGVVRIKGCTPMLSAHSLGVIDDTNVTSKCAEILAREIESLGFNVDFAPVVDINVNPNNTVIGKRSFSSNPQIVSKHASAYIKGIHKTNIACCLKHYPGHGDTDVDSHFGLPRISKSYLDLKKFELIPYIELLKDNPDMIMTAHILFPEIEKETYISTLTGEVITLPATLSKRIITDILRRDLKYDNVVATDALNMKAISDHFLPRDSAKYAINAGVDILTMPVLIQSEEDIIKIGEYIDQIFEMALKGEISIKNIDDAVLRILKLKKKLGLIDDEKNPSKCSNNIRKKLIFNEQKLRKAYETIGCEKHQKIQKQFLKRSPA